MKQATLTIIGYERVVHFTDPATGLNAFIAVHDTSLGPAIGGCRFHPYETEAQALDDVLRLAKGMTYKNALAGLDHGGGKAVIIGDPAKMKSRALLRAFGRAVENFAGSYYTAEDMGTSASDMEMVAETTPYVAGTPKAGGDPSPFTAFGVFLGIKRAVAHKLGKADLKGVEIIVKGLGHVGWELCRLLSDAGAKLRVADIDAGKVDRAVKVFDAHEVHYEEAFAKATDVYAPCALGGEFNVVTAPLVQAAIVAGSANNQLQQPEAGQALHERGVLYVPDYALNAGGVISVAAALAGHWSRERVRHDIERVSGILDDIFTRSVRDDRPTSAIADELALRRVREARAAARQVAADASHPVAM